ncbi:MAG: hypothetical protein WCG10_02190 [Chlamydiota bacterium]
MDNALYRVKGITLLLTLLIAPITTLTAKANPAITGNTAAYNSTLKTMETKSEQDELLKTTKATATQKATSPEVMIIDPATRAQDFKEAFNYLSLYKAGSPVYFELENNEKLYSVLDLSLMKGGTLVIFKINTTQGIKYRVVKTETIAAIGND